MPYEVIQNKEDWEKFFDYTYYFKESKRKIPEPMKYPCLAKKESKDGGLCGDYVVYEAAYPIDEIKTKGKTPMELLKMFMDVEWKKVFAG